jgi:hypothetical protein
MDVTEDEALEEKLQEISDQMGKLVLDILLMSMKKLVKENQVFNEFNEARLEAAREEYPF